MAELQTVLHLCEPGEMGLCSFTAGCPRELRAFQWVHAEVTSTQEGMF